MAGTMCNRSYPFYTPGSYVEGLKGQEENRSILLKNRSLEMCEGYRILKNLMRVSKLFLDEPDCTKKDMCNYYNVISKPMWFHKMQKKFIEGEYKKISEFVRDVRLLLVNCYHYFGPNNFHTLKALQVEEILEQSIALLPIELRNECTLKATCGIEFAEAFKLAEHCKSGVQQSVIGEQAHEIERKRLFSLEYGKPKEREEHHLLLWEKESIFVGKSQENMKNMWELPVVGHFIALLFEQLNIDNISMFELERIFLMSQASKSLAALMTALLSSPIRREKVCEKPAMPYKIWNKKLTHIVSNWFRKYIKSNKNPDFLFQYYGIEHQFWKIMGDWNPLDEYEFHELTFHQRVYLVKTLCDFILHKNKYIREYISSKSDEFGSCLGQDSLGGKFLYFPLFMNDGVRIYRQASDPKSWIERNLDHEAEFKVQKATTKKSGNNKECTTIKKRRRMLAWRRGIIGKRYKVSQPTNSMQTKNIYKITEKSANCNIISVKSKAKVQTASTTMNIKAKTAELSSHTNSEMSRIKSTIASTLSSECKSANINENIEELAPSHTDKLPKEVDDRDNVKQILCVLKSKVNFKEKEPIFCNNIKLLEEGSVSDNEIKQSLPDLVCEKKVQPLIVIREKKDFMVKKLIHNNEENISSYETESVNEFKASSDSLDNMPKLRRPLHNPYWLEPDPNDFNLVADSIEEVRLLLSKYCGINEKLVLNKKLKRKKHGKRCCSLSRSKLSCHLTNLLRDLESRDLKYKRNIIMTRVKLYKEWQDFQNRSADYVDPDEVFWADTKKSVKLSKIHNSRENEEALKNEKPSVITETGGYELMNYNNFSEVWSSCQESFKECDLYDGAMLHEFEVVKDLKDLDTFVGGMKLRQRHHKECYCEDNSIKMNTSDKSSDNEDWVKRKTGKRKRSKKFENINLDLLSPSKRIATSQKEQKALIEHQETQLEVVADPLPEIVKSHNESPNEGSLQQERQMFILNIPFCKSANPQLQLGRNNQTLLSSAVNQSTARQCIVTSSLTNNDNVNKRMSISSVISDVNQQEKVVIYEDVNTEVKGARKKDDLSQILEMRNTNSVDEKEKFLADSSKNILNSAKKLNRWNSIVDLSRTTSITSFKKSCYTTTEAYKKVLKKADEDSEASNLRTSGDKPVAFVPPSVDHGQTVRVIVGQKSKELLDNTKKGSQMPVHLATYSPSSNYIPPKINSTSAALLKQMVSVSKDSSPCAAPSQIIHQPGTQSIQNNSEVICVSDESDNSEVEFLGKYHNSKLNHLLPSKKLRKQCLFQSNQFGNMQEHMPRVGMKEINLPSLTNKTLTANSNQSHSLVSENKTLLEYKNLQVYPVKTFVNNSSMKEGVNIQSQNSNTHAIDESIVSLLSRNVSVSIDTRPLTSGTANTQSRTINSQSCPRIFSTLQNQSTTSGNMHVQPRTSFKTQIHRTILETSQAQIRTPGTLNHHSRMPGSSQLQSKTPLPRTCDNTLVNSKTPISKQVHFRTTGTSPNKPRTHDNTLRSSTSLQPRIPESKQRPMGTCSTPLMNIETLSQSQYSVRNHEAAPISTATTSQMYIKRSQNSSVMKRDSNKVQQQLSQETARLVVIPGDGKSASNYGLILPNGEKLILTPENIAYLRAANNGQLTTNVKIEWDNKYLKL